MIQNIKNWMFKRKYSKDIVSQRLIAIENALGLSHLETTFQVDDGQLSAYSRFNRNDFSKDSFDNEKDISDIRNDIKHLNEEMNKFYIEKEKLQALMEYLNVKVSFPSKDIKIVKTK